MIAPLPVKGWGQKPGSVSLPFFGVQLALLTHDGKEILDGTDGTTTTTTTRSTTSTTTSTTTTTTAVEGLLAVKSSWPSIIRSIHGDHKRMHNTYFPFPGYYLTGDNARRDHMGYYWITGRADDVCVVSGHNIGTAEVESALVSSCDSGSSRRKSCSSSSRVVIIVVVVLAVAAGVAAAAAIVVIVQ